MNGDTAQLSAKELKIVDGALELLKQGGDAGLTMRKLAERTDMRLSNVQYYFKSRDDVLKAMATRYFAECSAQIEALAEDNPGTTARQRAKRLILSGLQHGDELSDMCRIFRELWAISSRNVVIRDHMATYYRNFAAQIADIVLGGGADPERRARVASLLLPFIEGYSITAPSLPLSTPEIAEMLTDLVLKVGSD